MDSGELQRRGTVTSEEWPAKRLKLDFPGSVPAQQEQLEQPTGGGGAPSSAQFQQLEEARAHEQAQPFLRDQTAEEEQQALLQLHARAAAEAARAVGLSPMAALQALPHLVADFPLSRPALAGLFRPNSLATLVSEPPPHTPSEQAMMQQRHQGGSQLYGLPYLAQQHRQAPDRPLIGLATRPEYDAPPAPSYGLEVQDGSDVQDSLAADDEADGGEETDYTCHICRKVFKREMNLVFHMTTHRPKQPQEEAPGGDGTEVISCQDCGKTFGTKYQAKKHYLRRHFQGERPFPCNKCGKRFVVREDLTMHAKSCGNVYTCGSCNVRLCSLGALKRHCKHFNHTALSHEPLQDDMVATVGAYYPQQPSGQLTAVAGARGF